MKNHLILLSSLLLFSFGVMAQELKISQESSTELTKTSKSGRYGGTFLKDGKVKVVFVTSTKKEGVQIEQYGFDNTLAFNAVNDKFVTDEDATNEFAWYMPKEKIEKAAPSSQKFLLAGAAFGSGMKIKLGRLNKRYYLGVYTGMDFVEERELKPKTGDIWRIIPSGYKTTSKIDALSTDNGFYKDLNKYGNPLLAPANSPLLAVGVITEKVKMKGPWTSSGNRVSVLALDANNFDATKYNIYPLPFTAQSLSSGLGQDDNLAVLFAPLNGPTNVKSLKHFYWKDRKNNFTLMRFNDDYEMVDSVSYNSELMWGTFQIFNAHNSTFIGAWGKVDFDGWVRGFQLKKFTGIQITQIKDAKVLYSKLFRVEELERKLVVPQGDKLKYSLSVNHNKLKEVIPLPNGDILMFGQSDYESYALQLSPGGELMAFYRFPRINLKGDTRIYNYKFMIKGDDLYFVQNEQPIEFINSAKIETSSFTTVGAYVSTTTTTTTVKKLNEVFLMSQVIRVNTANHTMSNALVIDGKEYYTLGSFPAMFTNNAIYFTCRDKGPKGKKIFVVRVDL